MTTDNTTDNTTDTFASRFHENRCVVRAKRRDDVARLLHALGLGLVNERDPSQPGLPDEWLAVCLWVAVLRGEVQVIPRTEAETEA